MYKDFAGKVLNIEAMRKYMTEKKTILVLGDSIAAGFGLPAGSGWPTLVNGALPHGWQLLNHSTPGETLWGGWQKWKRMRNCQPRIVCLAYGLNDGYFHRSAADDWTAILLDLRRFGPLAWAWYHLHPRRVIPDVVIEPRLPLRHFRYLLGRFRRAARRMNARLLLLTPTPIDDNFHPEWPVELRRRQLQTHERYAEAIRRFAAAKPDVHLLDVRSILAAQGPSILAGDGIHLTLDGEKAIAAKVLAWLSTRESS